ncbi:MAG: hypothetical protein KF696_16320 [Planctomycetes bacterium]|nr:hypothetical protein [Planctomycetota bacterium]MCW8136946.1 hypothetical protein [Planctomycetota bacterium]
MSKALLLACVLLAGCSSSPYRTAPRYAEPETRQLAARELVRAVAFGGVGTSEVHGNERVLQWHERRPLAGAPAALLARELDLTALRAVTKAARHGENWEVKVDAPGGAVTFVFKNGQSASAAEACFKRLMRPD